MRISNMTISTLLTFMLFVPVAFAANLGDNVTIREGETANIGNWSVAVDSVAASGTARAWIIIKRGDENKSLTIQQARSQEVTLGNYAINLTTVNIILGRAATIMLDSEWQQANFSDSPCQWILMRDGETIRAGKFTVKVDSVAASGTARAAITVCISTKCSTASFRENETRQLSIGEEVTVSVKDIVLGRAVNLFITTTNAYYFSYTEYRCYDSDGGKNEYVRGTLTNKTVLVNKSFQNLCMESESILGRNFLTDYCASNRILQEYYCTANSSRTSLPFANESMATNASYSCQNGAFVKAIVQPSPAPQKTIQPSQPSEELPIKEIKPTSPVIEEVQPIEQPQEEAKPNIIVQVISGIANFFRSIFAQQPSAIPVSTEIQKKVGILADLTISDITWTYVALQPTGSGYNIVVTVKNQGGTKAENFQVSVLETTSNVQNTCEMTLEAGQSKTCSHLFTGPDPFQIKALADSSFIRTGPFLTDDSKIQAGKIEESNKTNNQLILVGGCTLYTQPVCGNKVCEKHIVGNNCPDYSENASSTCAFDCTVCGDGVCSGHESFAADLIWDGRRNDFCQKDCTVVLGDGICSQTENVTLIGREHPGMFDCGKCGDGICFSATEYSNGTDLSKIKFCNDNPSRCSICKADCG